MSELRQLVGGKGEEIAKEFLIEKGFRWKESNFRTRGGEIDLVMEDGKTLVFVEVKRRLSNQYGPAEEAITVGKMKHMTRTALLYIKATGAHERPMRFDVVTIDEKGIHHYADAFQVTTGNYYY